MNGRPAAKDELLIVGTGAMASLFASRLAAHGVQVVMLGTWKEALDVLNREGVTLVGADGDERAYPVRAVARAEECKGARLALVLVKSWQTPRAARQLKACLAPEGIALSLQNGLGNRETLTHYLGASRVALGVATLGATLLGPGRVRPGGEGVIAIEKRKRLEPLAALLAGADFRVERHPDPSSLLWGKLVINAAINPLTALFSLPNGELVRRPPERALMAAAAHEAAAVARAMGVRLPYSDPVAAVETVARSTASNRSSMLQDVQRGAPTEIDAISGAIVRAGEHHGVPTPVSRTLWELVKARSASEETQARTPGAHQLWDLIQTYPMA
jgi:2-dehydropantoate 2-reductase